MARETIERVVQGTERDNTIRVRDSERKQKKRHEKCRPYRDERDNK